MEPLLMKRGEVRAMLGISEGKVRDMVSCGILRQIFLMRDRRGRPQGYGYFERAAVMRVAKPGDRRP